MGNTLLIHQSLLEIQMVRLKGEQRQLDDVFYQSWLDQDIQGNVYFAKVKRIVPGLQAAFLEIGLNRHAFLPNKEQRRHNQTSNRGRGSHQAHLYESQTMLVQAIKPARGEKGATVTQNIRLSSPYLVYFPYQSGVSLSRQIHDESARQKIKQEFTNHIQTKEYNGSVIVRTAAQTAHISLLLKQLDDLIDEWQKIEQQIKTSSDKTARCIYQAKKVPDGILQDWMDDTTTSIVIDDKQLYQHVNQFCEKHSAQYDVTIHHHQSKTNLFEKYGAQEQIRSLYEKNVKLSNGAAIVIDYTEAMTVIDVNSASHIESKQSQELIYETNLLAAKEIVKHIKLRNISGLIAIDFIDMTSCEHQHQIRHTMQSLLSECSGTIKVGCFSQFGILEISRQRQANSWAERNMQVCKICSGEGGVYSWVQIVNRLVAEIIRLHTEHAANQYHVHTSNELIEFITKQTDNVIEKIQQTVDKKVIFEPQIHFSPMQFEIILS